MNSELIEEDKHNIFYEWFEGRHTRYMHIRFIHIDLSIFDVFKMAAIAGYNLTIGRIKK